MAYEVPALPYPYDALEPHIDEQTMTIHHDKHHQAYVDKANAALEGTDFADTPIEEVVSNLDAIPEDKRGAVRNHGGGAPDGALGAAIDAAFGSFDEFKAKFEAAGAGQFGSGWAWLVADGGAVEVMSTPNQDTPLASGKTPLLGNDVWEHAYYLTYKNARPAYLKAWWNTVNWAKVAERYSSACA